MSTETPASCRNAPAEARKSAGAKGERDAQGRFRGAAGAALRPGGHRRQAQRRQVDAAQRAGGPEDQHHLAKAQTTRHRITGVRTEGHAVRLRRHAGLPDPAQQCAEPLAEQGRGRRHRRRRPVVLFVVEAGQLHAGRRQGAVAAAPGIPAILVANKLDLVHAARRARALAARHAGAPQFHRVRADLGQERQGHRAPVGICAKYLPEQPWLYGADELTDRSEKFLAAR
jgi:GTPase Era involved in 16S rRNA processing